ncbi:MAG: hypothetical protein J6V91_04665 [Kiritimatiellae bacterium]|nr:hypothetical protein [Kiritimatiellia bacterium]
MLVHAVDYDATHLWITHAGACCGLRCYASVDYDAVHLWITMLCICGLRMLVHAVD